jgi:hypothetical protein
MSVDLVDFKLLRKPLSVKDILKDIELRWCKVCYLIINWRIDELRKFGEWRIPNELYEELAKHLQAYLNEDKMPPDQIASTVLNIADDVLRGDQVRLKAGDYIALENYRRSMR